MSHVAEIELKTKIDNLELLKKTCKRLGLVFHEGKKTYKWYGRHVGDYPLPAGFSQSDLGRCDHCMSIEGNNKAYEIGVIEKNGQFTFLWDFWQGGFGLEEKIGSKGENIENAYNLELTKSEMEILAIANGGFVEETFDTKTQEVVLTVSIM